MEAALNLCLAFSVIVTTNEPCELGTWCLVRSRHACTVWVD